MKLHQPLLPFIGICLGISLTIISILGIQLADRPLWQSQKTGFQDRAGDRLVGSYYPGEQPAGILLLEGFGSDQITMRSAASEFARLGVHVMTFDFSGHGRSPGTLGFDNAASDRLAWQVLAAQEHFQNLSGLKAEQIIFLGHSLGARVALQAASLAQHPPAGLVLLGTQVNLAPNTQSEFFTGVSDTDLDWVQALGPVNPSVAILMISGQQDDILTPAGAQLLADKLSGAPLQPGVVFVHLESAASRAWLLLPGLLHNYEVFSARVLGEAKTWAVKLWDLDIPVSKQSLAATGRVAGWIFGYAGLLLGTIGAASWLSARRELPTGVGLAVQITSLRRFLSGKLLLWLPAVPVGVLLAAILFFLPPGIPAFNLYYVGFLGGYGVLFYVLYRFGRVPGTQGRLPFTLPAKGSWLGALLAGVLALIISAAYARTGWFFVFPLNDRLIWLLLFTPLTALNFWIGFYELRLIIVTSHGKVWPQIAAALIGLLPFFLYAVFLAGLGSLSGVVGAVQGLLLLGWVLAFGYLLQQLSQRAWLIAFLQALLLYWLVLPQGVLFK